MHFYRGIYNIENIQDCRGREHCSSLPRQFVLVKTGKNGYHKLQRKLQQIQAKGTGSGMLWTAGREPCRSRKTEAA